MDRRLRFEDVVSEHLHGLHLDHVEVYMLLEVSQVFHIGLLGESDVREETVRLIMPLQLSSVVYLDADVVRGEFFGSLNGASLHETTFSSDDAAYVKIVLAFDHGHREAVHVRKVVFVDLLGKQVTFDGIAQRSHGMVPDENLAVCRDGQKTDLQLNLVFLRQAEPAYLRDGLTMEVLVGIGLEQELDRLTTEAFTRVCVPNEDLAVNRAGCKDERLLRVELEA